VVSSEEDQAGAHDPWGGDPARGTILRLHLLGEAARVWTRQMVFGHRHAFDIQGQPISEGGISLPVLQFKVTVLDLT
jgi:hypothetical protein